MRDRLRHHILLAALMATAACSSTGPSGLSPYFAYTVAPMNGGSVFFTGESASWHATVASTGSGRFLLTFGRPDQQGPINFDGVAFAASAHGSAVRSLPKADTVIVGAFPAETLIADN